MDRLPTDVTSALEMMRFGCPLDKPLGDPDVAYFERRILKAADILEAAVRQSLSQEAVRDEVLAKTRYELARSLLQRFGMIGQMETASKIVDFVLDKEGKWKD